MKTSHAKQIRRGICLYRIKKTYDIMGNEEKSSQVFDAVEGQPKLVRLGFWRAYQNDLKEHRTGTQMRTDIVKTVTGELTIPQ